MSYKVVSLFSGCGGLDLGFRAIDFELVYACDSDPAAVDCYRRNIGPHIHEMDVSSESFHTAIASFGGCDVVLGGFPCQGFSKAGPKRLDDPRNSLYLQMKRAVARLKPTIFVAENVDGLTQNFEGSYLEVIAADFASIGYRVEHKIIDAVAFGVAQHRRRVFIIGSRHHAAIQFKWPAPTHAVVNRNGDFKVQFFSLFDERSQSDGLVPLTTIAEAIGDLRQLSKNVPDHDVVKGWPKHFESIFRAVRQGQKLCNVRHSETSVYTWNIPSVFGHVTLREQTVLETISKNRRHKKYGNIPNGNPLPNDEIERLSGINCIEPEIASLLAKGYLKAVGAGYDLKGAMFCSGIFKRPNWDQPSPTVLTNFYNPRYFLHPLEDRPFSLRECARLQGFPDDFRILSDRVDLVGGYRLIGNAVAPPVSRQIAASVREYLRRTRSQAVSA